MTDHEHARRAGYLLDALQEIRRIRDGIEDALTESRTMQPHHRSAVTLAVLQEHLENVLNPDRAANEDALGSWPWTPQAGRDTND